MTTFLFFLKKYPNIYINISIYFKSCYLVNINIGIKYYPKISCCKKNIFLLLFGHNMARKKKLTYEQRMLAELQKLPNPIDDKRHELSIYFVNERARSNQTRFAHIIEARHELKQLSSVKIKKDQKHLTTI